MNDGEDSRPDPDGTVPRAQFPKVRLDTIVLTNVEDEWDLWIARGVSTTQEQKAKVRVAAMIASAIAPQKPEVYVSGTHVDLSVVGQHVRVLRQGCEHLLYRRQFKTFTEFEPPDSES